VAKRQQIAPRYIHMLFEAEGTTFSECVISQRLRLAHRSLRNPQFVDYCISAIAMHVGFGDPSNFNRTFKRRFGVTPSDVRAQARRGDGRE
jgi:AraC-like DNA-binding protein